MDKKEDKAEARRYTDVVHGDVVVEYIVAEDCVEGNLQACYRGGVHLLLPDSYQDKVVFQRDDCSWCSRGGKDVLEFGRGTIVR